MVHSFLKRTFICFAMLSYITMGFAENTKFLNDVDFQEIEEMSRDGMECNKICIGKVLARCIKTRHLKSEDFESDVVKAGSICAEMINTDNLCANNVNINTQLCTPALSAPVVCANQLNAANICASGMIMANALQQCGKYRATAVFSANTSYTLGTPIPWDTVLDDPNGDISLAPFGYTAPLSGYYIITAKINQNSLAGTSPIIGIPIANLEIWVNGILFRETFSPYLSFHNEQKLVLSTLISLNAGDVVTGIYEVYVMNDAVGFAAYSGTITIEGNGTEANNSLFKIHYLSSDCTSVPCAPCAAPCTPTPCTVPCQPSFDCHNMSCCDEN